ncbi:MAG: 50S ribosomal protein L29 [Phycisphaerales bacterium]|nr:50S ribosomal protein L29 [Phycisphaerales bacterium]
MKMNEVKKLSLEELVVEASRVRRSIYDLRSQVVTEKVKDTSQFSKLRTDLARILTETSARRVTSAAAAQRKVSA